MKDCHFAARIIELGERDPDKRIVLTKLNGDEICLEMQSDEKDHSIKKIGFLLLSVDECVGLIEALRAVIS